MFSKIDLNPRAPVLRPIALSATAVRASGVKVSLTFSIVKSSWYCLTSAFLGSVRIRTSASVSKSSRVARTGIRPISSGMRPNLVRSSGSTSLRISPTRRSSGPLTLAPMPIPLPWLRWDITLSRPAKAPPQMNKMFVVSTWRNSC